MSRATVSDVVDELAGDNLEPITVEDVHDLGHGELTETVRLIGPATRPVARHIDGGVLLGGEAVRVTRATARALCESLRALPADKHGRVRDGAVRPRWCRGVALLTLDDAQRATPGQTLTDYPLGPSPTEYVAPNEVDAELLVVKLVRATVSDVDGVEYGPGTVVRGLRVDLAPLVARGSAVAVPDPARPAPVE